MKKLLKRFSTVFVFMLALVFFAPYSYAIDIYCDGTLVKSDQPPVIKNSRVYVPIRVISEHLGAKVDYLKEQKIVSIEKADKNISLTIGKKDMWISDKEMAGPKMLDDPPFILNGRTMLPLRAIAEIFGSGVDWDADKKDVYIYVESGANYLKDYINEQNAGDEVLYKLRVLGTANENERYYVTDVKPEEISDPSSKGYAVTIRKDNPVDPELTELVGHYFINSKGTVLMEYDVVSDSYNVLIAVN